MESNDILLNDEFGFKIENGDFFCGNSEEQNMQLIMIANKGSFRHNPLIGIGAGKYLKRKLTIKNIDEFKHTIYLQLKMDGFNKISVQLNSFDDINIKAER
jgi:hypothetical protein